MPTEIYIQKNALETGQLRFDLMGRNLPENLLGLAADLQFTGDLKNRKFDHYEWGEVLTGKDFTPILLIKPDWDTGRLILGITQESGQLKKVQDGRLASFYFNGKGELNFSGFARQILSIYSNKRIDLNNVIWKKPEQIQKTTLPETDADVQNPGTDQLQKTVQSATPSQSGETAQEFSANSLLKTDVFQPDKEISDGWPEWLWILPVLAVIALIFLVWFRLKRRP